MKMNITNQQKYTLITVNKFLEKFKTVNERNGLKSEGFFDKKNVRKHNKVISCFYGQIFRTLQDIIRYPSVEGEHHNNLKIKVISSIESAKFLGKTFLSTNDFFDEFDNYISFLEYQNNEGFCEDSSSYLYFLSEHLKCIPRSLPLFNEDEEITNVLDDHILFNDLIDVAILLIESFLYNEFELEKSEKLTNIINLSRKDYNNKYNVSGYYNALKIISELYLLPN